MIRKSDGSVAAVYRDTVKSSERTITKPATTRRLKPKDLWIGQTARKVSFSAQSFTNGTTDYSSTQYLSAPGFYWGPISPNRKIASPTLAGFADMDNKLRKKIKDSNLNLAQSMAEYKQTGNMVAGAVEDVLKTFHSLRSGRAVSDFVRTLRSPETRSGRRIANRWLVYQYGLRPTLNDIHESANALLKTIQVGKWIYTGVHDRVKLSSKSESTLYRQTIDETLWRKAQCRYLIQSSAVKQLSEVGITNPLLLAWELVPYSFVVDWFINIGDYLGGLDALLGVSQISVIRSYKYEGKVYQVGRTDNGSFIRAYEGWRNDIETERLAVTSSLSFGNLAFNPSLTSGRLLNAAALLRQLKF